MDLQSIAIMSSKRAKIYHVIINIFTSLPDEKFLEYMYSSELLQFLEMQKELQYPLISDGVNLITGFLEKHKSAEKPSLLEALAVDRTKLIRVPSAIGLKAPYESQYHKEMKTSHSLQRLVGVYRKAGFVPAATHESPDFFCIELDFMRVTSNRIANEHTEAKTLLGLQKDFLNEHLGAWVGEYVKEAITHAETDFYKGWLMVLQGVVEVEKIYLQSC